MGLGPRRALDGVAPIRAARGRDGGPWGLLGFDHMVPLFLSRRGSGRARAVRQPGHLGEVRGFACPPRDGVALIAASIRVRPTCLPAAYARAAAAASRKWVILDCPIWAILVGSRTTYLDQDARHAWRAGGRPAQPAHTETSLDPTRKARALLTPAREGSTVRRAFFIEAVDNIEKVEKMRNGGTG